MKKSIAVTTLAIGVMSCSGYRLTVNDNDLTHPRELFADYALVDPVLQRCVGAIIEDRKITQASGLSQLNCSRKGVRNLEGLEIFSSLRYVDMSGNSISSVAPLLTFTQLEEVNLNHNATLLCDEVDKLKRIAGKVKASQCDES